MNADFEAELAALPRRYVRTPTIARRNRRLAPTLLYLARSGDTLLLEPPWSPAERSEAARRGVALVEPERASGMEAFALAPWGWTPGAIEAGERAGAVVDAPPIEVVARVNSKAWSHEVERALGVEVLGAGLASTRAELDALVARACPGLEDKWVVKALYGFAARERVLGRGPALDPPSALWAERRFARGEALLFEPWLDVRREVGVQLEVGRDGAVEVLGVSRMLTNGAGVTTGFEIGSEAGVSADLSRVAAEVGRRLAGEGYWGPVNVDALEHAGGLRPLLEVNARRTMGLVALAVERERRPVTPEVWSPTSSRSGM